MRRTFRPRILATLALAFAFAIPATALGPSALGPSARAAVVPTSAYLAIGATGSSSVVTRYHVPVLMYHRIAPASERGNSLADLVISPTRFDAQLRALKAAGWHTITSAQLAAAMAARRAVPARTFVITIDDGRRDGYTYAFPILRRYGFVATYFVVTGRVGNSRYLSWPQMLEMQAAGMEIGNHTVSHVNEAAFSRTRTDSQVMGAQRVIRRQLGVTPVSFAYPYGATPPNLVASVRASGLKVAYTTVYGARETLATRYFLPRVRIHPTTTASGIVALLRPYR